MGCELKNNQKKKKKRQMKNKQTKEPKNDAKQKQRKNSESTRPFIFASERAWSWTKL